RVHPRYPRSFPTRRSSDLPQARTGPPLAVTDESLASASVRHVLTGESAGDNVYGLDLGPVGGSNVSEVGDLGPVVGEDLRRCGVELAVPGDGAADGLLDAHVEAAIVTEQRTNPNVTHSLSIPYGSTPSYS